MGTPWRSDAGFTLIEMIVAMVLVAGLLATVSTMLVKSFGESDRAQAERTVADSTRRTFESFSNDIRSAQTPDRNPAYVGNAEDLGDALLQPTTTKLSMQMPGQPGVTTLDVRDVVEATNSSFAFRSDAVPAIPGVECVRYWVQPTTRSFVRSVLRYQPAAAPGAFGTCDTTNPISETILVKQVL
jgi:prepilin-type N-terminal cleavage/methylation domain-containing protein